MRLCQCVAWPVHGGDRASAREVWGSAVSSLSGVWVEFQPKSILAHFSLKI